MQCNFSRVAEILYPESTPLLSHILQLLTSGKHKTSALKTPGKITTINARSSQLEVFKYCLNGQGKMTTAFLHIQEVLHRPIAVMMADKPLSQHTVNQVLAQWLF